MGVPVSTWARREVCAARPVKVTCGADPPGAVGRGGGVSGAHGEGGEEREGEGEGDAGAGRAACSDGGSSRPETREPGGPGR